MSCVTGCLQAMLEIAAGDDGITSVNLDYVIGDKTGYLHLQDGQTAYVEYSTYQTLRSAPPTNFHIDDGSNIWLSADFKLIGLQQPAMQVGLQWTVPHLSIMIIYYSTWSILIQ